MFHSTPTPLLEEYATAKHSWDLSSIDMCEIARYSCLAAFQRKELLLLHGEDDPNLTNIPSMRLEWRKAQLEGEWKGVGGGDLK
jgi:AMP deaminase